MLGDYVLKEKLKALRHKLNVWNREEFGDIQQKISLTRERPQ